LGAIRLWRLREDDQFKRTIDGLEVETGYLLNAPSGLVEEIQAILKAGRIK
jgi:hypothetical protein